MRWEGSAGVNPGPFVIIARLDGAAIGGATCCQALS